MKDTMYARQKLKFRLLPGPYAIVRLAPDAPVPEWATKGDFNSVTRSADELSIVCLADNIPVDVNSESKWICLKLEGPFPFSQTGVLLSFIEPLSNNCIPISPSPPMTRIMFWCRKNLRVQHCKLLISTATNLSKMMTNPDVTQSNEATQPAVPWAPFTPPNSPNAGAEPDTYPASML